MFQNVNGKKTHYFKVLVSMEKHNACYDSNASGSNGPVELEKRFEGLVVDRQYQSNVIISLGLLLKNLISQGNKKGTRASSKVKGTIRKQDKPFCSQRPMQYQIR
jgi:hypothetical protein